MKISIAFATFSFTMAVLAVAVFAGGHNEYGGHHEYPDSRGAQQHLEGFRGDYDNDYDNSNHDLNVKAHKDNSNTGYALSKNKNDDFGFDQHSQASSKDAAARKKSKAASANKAADMNLNKELESKATNKNSHNKKAASASAVQKQRNAQASKKHAKNYSRAKNINIYSKKASDVTKSFEDNSASAKSSSKDSEAKKAAAQDKGSNAALRSNENKLNLAGKTSSKASSDEHSNAAHIKTAANNYDKGGHKSSFSDDNLRFLKRSSPSSFLKRSTQAASRPYVLGTQHLGSFKYHQGFPVGSTASSNSQGAGTGSGFGGGSALTSNAFGIGSSAIPGYEASRGGVRSSLSQTSAYPSGAGAYRPSGVVLGSLSNVYGLRGQPSSNTFGIGGGFSQTGGSKFDSVSMSNIATSMNNIGSGSGFYGIPTIHVHKGRSDSSGRIGSMSKTGVPEEYWRNRGALSGSNSFESFGSEIFGDFDDDDDDSDLDGFSYGSSGFDDGW